MPNISLVTKPSKNASKDKPKNNITTNSKPAHNQENISLVLAMICLRLSAEFDLCIRTAL